MKRITQLVLIGIVTHIFGCTPIGKLYYGVKRPDYESEVSIRQFVSKLGLPQVPVYSLSYDAWKSDKRLQSPDVYVFDKEGRYIPYKDPLKPNCTGPAELFLSYLDTSNIYHYSDEYTLNAVCEQLNSTDCSMHNPLVDSQNDFCIFVTFTKWQGKKFQKKKTLVWLDSLQQNKRIRYDLILVNCDFQDCWSEAQKHSLE
ncbi:MAG TPA: hypothetical protein PKD91_06120 [Bacteroidia bacterium]|nr:hypothetical protein [Bacteroidia bacterium]